MTSREISAAAQTAASNETPTTSDQALIAMRDLLVSFITATENAGREAMQWMSIDQIRIFNQMHLAAGL